MAATVSAPPGASAMTLEQVLALPVVRHGLPEVVCCREQLDRRLRWVHILDLAEVGGLLRGGELVLTTGVALAKDPQAQREFIKQLAEGDAAGLAIELGAPFRSVPPGMIVEAERRRLPIIALRRRVRFVEVTRAVHAAIMSRDYELLQRADALQQELLDLLVGGQGVEAVLRRLSDALRNPIVLEDAIGELVCVQAHGVDDEALFDALAAARRSEREDTPNAGALAAQIDLPGGDVARLWALQVESPFDDVAVAAVTRAGTVVALALRKDGDAAGLGASSRGAFLMELARGRLREEQATLVARSFDFPLEHGGLLPAAAVWRDRLDGQTPVRPPWAPMLADIRRAVADAGFPLLAGIHDGGLFMVIGIRSRTLDGDLCDTLANAVFAGLARHGYDHDDVAFAVGEAEPQWTDAGRGLPRIARIAAAAERSALWHDGRRSTIVDFLYSIRDEPGVSAFIADQIGPLLGDDPRKRDLVATLEAFLAHGGRKVDAARALHLERQSLYHRLDRIEKLLGADLGDEDVRLGAHLALRMRRMRRAHPGAGSVEDGASRQAS